jgi:serine/threonine protein phosphatase PrpC
MDNSIVIYKNPLSEIEFFGVFDGHGGANTARFCSHYFQK